MKTPSKRIILLLIAIISFVAAFVLVKFTHGIVVWDCYKYEDLNFDFHSENGIKLVARIGPRVTEGKPNSYYAVREFEEAAFWGLLASARTRGADVRVDIISDERLSAAHIRKVTVIDARGETARSYYQNQELKEKGNGKNYYTFSNVYFDWHGIYTEGAGEIHIRGDFLLAGKENRKTDFEFKIPIESDSVRKYITRKKWDSFFETNPNPSIWSNI